MKVLVQSVAVAATLVLAHSPHAQTAAAPGKEEFGLTPRQLVQSIEKVEAGLSRCMRSQGFQLRSR